MAEDATRRLLRAFGIAVTDCEDALGELEAVLRGPSPHAASEPIDAYDRTSRELETRWAELAHHVESYRTRGREALVAALRARGAA